MYLMMTMLSVVLIKINKTCTHISTHLMRECIAARAEQGGRRDLLRRVAALGGRAGGASGAVVARGGRSAGRGGVAAPRRRHLAHAPAHVPLPQRRARRLPVRADGGRGAPGRGGFARRRRRHAALDPVRAHARLHHAYRCASPL